LRPVGLGGAAIAATTAAAAATAVADDERDVWRVQRRAALLGLLHAHPALDLEFAGRIVDRQKAAPLLHC
jgi:hypothetical protein